jgi:hypothetical protein
LKAAANAGARLYLEGAPSKDENGKAAAWRMSALVGGDVKALPTSKTTAMTLQDTWMFGTARGISLNVQQSVNVTVGSGTVAAQTRSKKGLDVLTKPRVMATLADGSPALIVNPVGKGEVIWAPHRAIDFNQEAMSQYYAAIAAYVQPGLVTLRATGGVNPGGVRIALRRSKGGTLLLGLFNSSAQAVPVAASVNGVAGVALDLANERELPLSTRGYQTEVTVTVPADGWSLLALATDRKKLDAERSAPLAAARLK